MSHLRFIIAQLGARQHYAVPEAFFRNNALSVFYTDFWVQPVWLPFLSHLPHRYAQKLCGRSNPALKKAPVKNLTLPPSAVKNADQWQRFSQTGERFAQKVTQQLKKRKNDPKNEVYFGFTTTALETLEYWNAIGGKSILDQIDLSAVHYDIVREEQRQYPGWENRNIGTPSADYIQRSCREWELASRVLVNSEWCASALIRQGVAAEKIMVVPQAYSGIISPKCNHYDGRRNLHVLFLGNVNLAKGAHYLLQAAEKLTDSAEFYFAGNIHFLTDKIMNAPSNVTFLGAIPPAACVGLWQWADVLVFPTLSDGFGIVQLEAMAYGVPVIATDRCGQVVTDEKNGFVIPVKDAAAIVEKLEILANKPELLKEMSIQATETLKIFNLDRYYQNVETLFAGETKK